MYQLLKSTSTVLGPLKTCVKNYYLSLNKYWVYMLFLISNIVSNKIFVATLFDLWNFFLFLYWKTKLHFTRNTHNTCNYDVGWSFCHYYSLSNYLWRCFCYDCWNLTSSIFLAGSFIGEELAIIFLIPSESVGSSTGFEILVISSILCKLISVLFTGSSLLTILSLHMAALVYFHLHYC